MWRIIWMPILMSLFWLALPCAMSESTMTTTITTATTTSDKEVSNNNNNVFKIRESNFEEEEETQQPNMNINKNNRITRRKQRVKGVNINNKRGNNNKRKNKKKKNKGQNNDDDNNTTDNEVEHENETENNNTDNDKHNNNTTKYPSSCPATDACRNGKRFKMHRVHPSTGCITRCKTTFAFRQGWECGGCQSVWPSDVVLVRPPDPATVTTTTSTTRTATTTRTSKGKKKKKEDDNDSNNNDNQQPRRQPIISSITAYNWLQDHEWRDKHYELPIYASLNREEPDFWNYLLDELLLSRMPVVLWHGRGCWDKDPDLPHSNKGTGNMCPRLLSQFVEAVERAGVQDVIRVGMWDDTGMYKSARNRIVKHNGTNDDDDEDDEGDNDDNEDGEDETEPKFDISNESNWQFFWDYNIKIWFDTIPPNLWYRMDDGRPIIVSWNLRGDKFVNQQGNASRLLAWLISQFTERYGVAPYFILEDSWFVEDTTITPDVAPGRYEWFNLRIGQAAHTYIDYNDDTWGCAVPGFRDPNTNPGCGLKCRELSRQQGRTLQNALQQGHEQQAKFVLLEGWSNMIESSGFYRSSDWDEQPTQYINLVRQYADPEPETLLLQAEGVDRFSDTTEDNLGGHYADRALDVGRLPNHTGWYVGWVEAGEWIEYQNVQLGCGLYRFTARAASVDHETFNGTRRLRLDLASLPSVSVPDTTTTTTGGDNGGGGDDEGDVVDDDDDDTNSTTTGDNKNDTLSDTGDDTNSTGTGDNNTDTLPDTDGDNSTSNSTTDTSTGTDDGDNDSDHNHHNYVLIHLGEVQLQEMGKYDLRIVFETPGIHLDWFFVKRIATYCSSRAKYQARPTDNHDSIVK